MWTHHCRGEYIDYGAHFATCRICGRTWKITWTREGIRYQEVRAGSL